MTQIVLDAEVKMSFAERLSTAGTTTLMGMVAVFAVLTIIMLIVMLMGKIVGGQRREERGEEEGNPRLPRLRYRLRRRRLKRKRRRATKSLPLPLPQPLPPSGRRKGNTPADSGSYPSEKQKPNPHGISNNFKEM